MFLPGNPFRNDNDVSRCKMLGYVDRLLLWPLARLLHLLVLRHLHICIIFCQGPFWPSTKYTFLVKVHKMLYSSSSTLMWISLRCPALLAICMMTSWKILKLDHIICIYVNLSCHQIWILVTPVVALSILGSTTF